MMQRVGEGGAARAGIRMGLWGAAQAVAFGGGGLIATLASDVARHVVPLAGGGLRACVLWPGGDLPLRREAGRPPRASPLRSRGWRCDRRTRDDGGGRPEVIALAIDVILALVVAEGVALVALHRLTGAGIPPRRLLGTLTAGFFLMLATRLGLVAGADGTLLAQGAVRPPACWPP